MVAKATANTVTELFGPRKLDVACGQNKQKGFTGIDIAGDADITCDLFTFPWPIRTGAVREVFCSHFVEHIPHYRPEWSKDGWWLFFEELHRICSKSAKLTFLHPYAQSSRAFQDPTHTRFINEATWAYLSKEWRVSQGLDHYDTDVDFEIVSINGMGVPDDINNRNEEFQTLARLRDWNIISDLQVVLKARK